MIMNQLFTRDINILQLLDASMYLIVVTTCLFFTNTFQSNNVHMVNLTKENNLKILNLVTW